MEHLASVMDLVQHLMSCPVQRRYSRLADSGSNFGYQDSTACHEIFRSIRRICYLNSWIKLRFVNDMNIHTVYIMLNIYIYIRYLIYISADPSKGEGAREAGILRIWGVPCFSQSHLSHFLPYSSLFPILPYLNAFLR